jgi:hypothetical protein
MKAFTHKKTDDKKIMGRAHEEDNLMYFYAKYNQDDSDKN